MANKACPKCGSYTWWWRDDSGCSACVKDNLLPIAKRMTAALQFHPDAFILSVAPLVTEEDYEAFLRRLETEFGGDSDVV